MSKKILYGEVRNRNKKTIAVEVEKNRMNKKYKKNLKKKKIYLANNNEKEPDIGQKVYIIESKPFSKKKKWKIFKNKQKKWYKWAQHFQLQIIAVQKQQAV